MFFGFPCCELATPTICSLCIDDNLPEQFSVTFPLIRDSQDWYLDPMSPNTPSEKTYILDRSDCTYTAIVPINDEMHMLSFSLSSPSVNPDFNNKFFEFYWRFGSIPFAIGGLSVYPFVKWSLTHGLSIPFNCFDTFSLPFSIAGGYNCKCNEDPSAFATSAYTCLEPYIIYNVTSTWNPYYPRWDNTCTPILGNITIVPQ